MMQRVLEARRVAGLDVVEDGFEGAAGHAPPFTPPVGVEVAAGMVPVAAATWFGRPSSAEGARMGKSEWFDWEFFMCATAGRTALEQWGCPTRGREGRRGGPTRVGGLARGVQARAGRRVREGRA